MKRIIGLLVLGLLAGCGSGSTTGVVAQPRHLRAISRYRLGSVGSGNLSSRWRECGNIPRTKKGSSQTLKPIDKLKHSLYKLLDRPGLRSILTALATIIATIRVGKLCKVSYEGEWVQRFPSCTLVEPRLTLWTPEQIERHISAWWMYQYLPSKGDTIVDVGANTGWETLFFSRSVGMSGRVISIEAHPRTFRCLSKMCEKNRLQNVTLVQAAVGDQEREVQLSDSYYHEANSIIREGSGIRVAGTTLDYIFRSLRLSRVDFLKMNIEGAERLALSGMGEMAQRTKNVCISCHDFLANEGGSNEMRTKADVITFLKQNGFAVLLRESDAGCVEQDLVYGLNERLLTNNKA
jgi:FkbM family methyltransferase